MKKYFFGWENLKWFIQEIVKMYSGGESYFSKKRIESGLAFIILQWGMIHWFVVKIESITSSDLIMWAGVEAAISGYIISQIQSEKKNDSKEIK